MCLAKGVTETLMSYLASCTCTCKCIPFLDFVGVTTSPPCQDQSGVDCASYGDEACVNFPDWAKNTCPRRCGRW